MGLIERWPERIWLWHRQHDGYFGFTLDEKRADSLVRRGGYDVMEYVPAADSWSHGGRS
jgi:hypothetical protein